VSLQPLPEVTEESAAFWRGGADGVLRIVRCQPCGTWIHPPAPVCPVCLSADVALEATSGRAVVESFTVNAQPWAPDLAVPYTVGVVSLDDAPGVQLTTRFVEIDADGVHIGMAVEVTFEPVADIHLPLFRPASR
jgi:uncharacterized OB-fold protein